MEEREEKDMAEEMLGMEEGRRKSSMNRDISKLASINPACLCDESSCTPFSSIYQNLLSY